MEMLVSAICAVLILSALVGGIWRRARRPTTSQTANSNPYAAYREGRQSDDPFDGPADRRVHRERRRQAPAAPDYRVSVGASGDDRRWDPHAPENSRRQNVRDARKRGRRQPRPNYYELLEIEEGASDAQIGQAFRRQAAKWHPDRFHQDPDAQPAAEARFRELRAAMDVLRDPTKRALYDAER